MTQIGIGQLKHAKAANTAATANLHEKVQLQRKISQHERAKKNREPSKNEGQLSVDILQTDTEMIVVCPIAGVEKADVKVAIQDDVLTIRGERKKPESLDGKQALVRELFWGTFSRSIVLPDHIDRKNIQARVHEHMLIISIPKTEDFKTRIIHINEEA